MRDKPGRQGSGTPSLTGAGEISYRLFIVSLLLPLLGKPVQKVDIPALLGSNRDSCLAGQLHAGCRMDSESLIVPPTDFPPTSWLQLPSPSIHRTHLHTQSVGFFEDVQVFRYFAVVIKKDNVISH